MSDGSTTNSEYPSRQEVQTRNLADSARQREIARRERGVIASRIVLSAPLERLARRLGKTADELADGIDPDTLRRLKYPIREHEADDGTVEYSEPVEIIEGRRSTYT